MYLVRSMRQRKPTRAYIRTPYGRVPVYVEGEHEIARAEGGAARILLRLHGFTEASDPSKTASDDGAETPPQAPADIETTEPPAPAPEAAGEAPGAPHGVAKGHDEGHGKGNDEARRSKLAGTLDEIADGLAAGPSRASVVAAEAAEAARPKPRKGALALFADWLAAHP